MRRGRTPTVFFGAPVKLKMKNEELEICIVGVDEVDASRGRVCRLADRQGAAQGARGRPSHAAHAVGDEKLEILDVRYL